jgi:hypothetical protein
VSDRIYSTDEQSASNFVVIAEACRGILAKRFLADGSVIPYDRVKWYNFHELEISCLYDLYTLCIGLLDRPKNAIIRCRIKDLNVSKSVVRKCNGEEATLILVEQNWFTIDIDGFDISTGNLEHDCSIVLEHLPIFFRKMEYFAIASASYGVEPGIHIRMFFWSHHAISNISLKKAMTGSIVDLAIFNPIQLIYTAKPIGIGHVRNRIIWHSPLFPKALVIPSYSSNNSGDPEKWYTKQQAEPMLENALIKIEDLTEGSRHDGLRDLCYFIGKLVGQGHFEYQYAVERLDDACSRWSKRDAKKDMETVLYGLDHGIVSMGRE